MCLGSGILSRIFSSILFWISRHPRTSSAIWEIRSSNLSTPRCCLPPFPRSTCSSLWHDVMHGGWSGIVAIPPPVPVVECRGNVFKFCFGSVLICFVDNNDGTYMLVGVSLVQQLPYIRRNIRATVGITTTDLAWRGHGTTDTEGRKVKDNFEKHKDGKLKTN